MTCTIKGSDEIPEISCLIFSVSAGCAFLSSERISRDPRMDEDGTLFIIARTPCSLGLRRKASLSARARRGKPRVL